MTPTAVALVTVGFGLAYANGANDVSKGIATLVGSGVSNYRRAIVWGTLWTGVGGVLGALLASAMVTTFGGALLAPGATQTLNAAMATLLGAALWVLVATRTGLPVSTTHAIVGSLVGVAAASHGIDGVHWSAMGGKVVLPLLLTPVLSLALVSLLLKWTKRYAGSGTERLPDCLCAEVVEAEPLLVGGSVASRSRTAPTPQLEFVLAPQEICAAAQPNAARLTLDHLHWATAGAASLARGMNDAPKIVALILAASLLDGAFIMGPWAAFSVVVGGMTLGSIIAGRRVTAVLAERVTPMDHREGFIANLVTAGLVTTGATLGLPMSTTHVSSGGIIGAGRERGSLSTKTLKDLLLAWVVTLPAAAALGISALLIGKWLT